MTLHEVLSIIEDEADDVDHVDVYVMPPGDGQNSDEDSGDDDEADGSINRLPKSQLCNPGSAIITRHGGASTSLGTETEEECEESQVNELIKWKCIIKINILFLYIVT